MYTGDQYLINAYCPSSAWIQYQLKTLPEQRPTITNRTNFISFHVDKIVGSLNQIQCTFEISSLFLKELLNLSLNIWRIWYFLKHCCYLNQWKQQFKNYDIIVTIKISNHGLCPDLFQEPLLWCESDRHFISWLKSNRNIHPIMLHHNGATIATMETMMTIKLIKILHCIISAFAMEQ